MGFVHKKIIEKQNIQEPQHKKNTFLVVFFALVGVLVVVGLGSLIVNSTKDILGFATKVTIKTVSKALGTPMQTDSTGQINVLVVGYGGDGHQGGYLADTIIVVSFNPQKGAVTMISIPRDLYVKKENGLYAKINSVFPSAFSVTQTFSGAAETLAKKVTEITGLPITYYALIDFQGFEGLIDSVGGIDIYVPETIVDTSYPLDEKRITTFTILSGRNHIDGATALKYARSRHSTSDFSRSGRQQDIIKALIKKLKDDPSVKSIAGLKSLYGQYVKMVQTNVTMPEILWLSQFAFDLKEIFAFNYTTNCGYSKVSSMVPGCFLYTPPMEAFGGMSVVLPNSATPSSVSNYESTQSFAGLAAYHQEYLIEHPIIQVINGVDSVVAKKYSRSKGVANNIAVKMRMYGFTLLESENSSGGQDQTVVTIYGTGEYAGTLQVLKYFLPYDLIQTGNKPLLGTGDVRPDITITLGSGYLAATKGKRFSFDRLESY